MKESAVEFHCENLRSASQSWNKFGWKLT